MDNSIGKNSELNMKENSGKPNRKGNNNNEENDNIDLEKILNIKKEYAIQGFGNIKSFFSEVKFSNDFIEEKYQNDKETISLLLDVNQGKKKSSSNTNIFYTDIISDLLINLVFILGYVVSLSYLIFAYFNPYLISVCIFFKFISCIVVYMSYTIKKNDKPKKKKKLLFYLDHLLIFLSSLNLNIKVFIICFVYINENNDNSEELIRVIIYQFVSTNMYLIVKLEASIKLTLFYFAKDFIFVILAQVVSYKNHYYYLEGLTSFSTYFIFYIFRKIWDIKLRSNFVEKLKFRDFYYYVNDFVKGLNGYHFNLFDEKYISYNDKFSKFMKAKIKDLNIASIMKDCISMNIKETKNGGSKSTNKFNSCNNAPKHKEYEPLGNQTLQNYLNEIKIKNDFFSLFENPNKPNNKTSNCVYNQKFLEEFNLNIFLKNFTLYDIQSRNLSTSKYLEETKNDIMMNIEEENTKSFSKEYNEIKLNIEPDTTKILSEEKSKSLFSIIQEKMKNDMKEKNKLKSNTNKTKVEYLGVFEIKWDNVFISNLKKQIMFYKNKQNYRPNVSGKNKHIDLKNNANKNYINFKLNSINPNRKTSDKRNLSTGFDESKNILIVKENYDSSFHQIEPSFKGSSNTENEKQRARQNVSKKTNSDRYNLILEQQKIVLDNLQNKSEIKCDSINFGKNVLKEINYTEDRNANYFNDFRSFSSEDDAPDLDKMISDRQNYFDLFIRKVILSNGKIIYNIIFYDVSDLISAKNKILYEDFQKIRIFAKIAHEFKTPLNSILSLLNKIYKENYSNGCNENIMSLINFSQKDEDKRIVNNNKINNSSRKSLNSKILEINENKHGYKSDKTNKLTLSKSFINKSDHLFKKIEHGNENRNGLNIKENIAIAYNLLNSINFLVSDIITLSHLNNLNQINIRNENLNFLEILYPLKNILETLIYLSRAKSKNIKAEVIIDKNIYFDLETQDFIKSDNFRVRQILYNFISNSVKFTNAGKISIELKLIEANSLNNEKIEDLLYFNDLKEVVEDIKEAKKNYLCLSVNDTGIGIEEENKKFIFNSNFVDDYKHNKITDIFKINGFGLMICKHLAKVMKIQIGFKSQANEGSKFFILIPYTPFVTKKNKIEFQNNHSGEISNISSEYKNRRASEKIEPKKKMFSTDYENRKPITKKSMRLRNQSLNIERVFLAENEKGFAYPYFKKHISSFGGAIEKAIFRVNVNPKKILLDEINNINDNNNPKETTNEDLMNYSSNTNLINSNRSKLNLNQVIYYIK